MTDWCATDFCPAFSESPEALLASLFDTYPLYRDGSSRRAVRACFEALLDVSLPCFQEFVRLLAAEASKPGLAPQSALVLVEWTALAIRRCVTQPSWKAHANALVQSDALLLDLICGSTAKRSVQNAARRVNRHVFGAACLTSDVGKEATKAAILQLTQKGTFGYRSAALLGSLVPLDLDSRDEEEPGSESEALSKVLTDCKSHYITFWIREVLGSRAVVPSHVVSAFRAFLGHFVTRENVEQDIAPALEKSILRAPEVALNGLAASMFSYMPYGLDLSEVVSHRLLKPLMANLKSPSYVLSDGSLAVFRETLPRCGNDRKLKLILDETLGLLVYGKTTAQQKISYCAVLALATKPGVLQSKERSTAIVQGVASLVAKETNEAALAAEAKVLTTHTNSILNLQAGQDTDAPAIAGSYTRGLTDKRPAFQRIWASEVGDLFLNAPLEGPPMVQFLQAVIPNLYSIFNEIVTNPVSAAQSGLIVVAYVLLIITLSEDGTQASKNVKGFDRARVIGSALTSDLRKSFLLNPKYFTKIDQVAWLNGTLRACCEPVISLELDSPIPTAWAQALLYSAVGQQLSGEDNRDALKTLFELYQEHPRECGRVVICGMWAWHHDLATESKESAAVAAQSGMTDMIHALRAICPSGARVLVKESENELVDGHVDKEVLEDQLIQMLVLCNPEIIPRAGWIDFCLRMGQDPGELASKRPLDCVSQINQTLDGDSGYFEPVQVAAYRSFAELAFVSPEAITPLVVDQLSQDLALSHISDFDAMDYAIARTPEGTAFVDVLSSKAAAPNLHKGSSDYNLLKWEAEVRAQVASKKGAVKKLTADEQAKMDVQLSKEAKIRDQVLQAKRKILRGIGIAHGLATGPPTEAVLWIGPSVRHLLDLIEMGIGLLVGSKADEAYIACSDMLPQRLGPLRPFIGVAALRAVGSSHVPENMREEPLGTLVTRILYRLRIAGEQRPFDTVSLIYMLPLMMIVLTQKGVGVEESDAADEQVTLALEFLSIHVESFSDQHLPRNEVMRVLIQAMQAFTQHYKLIRDCLLDVASAISENADEKEVKTLLLGTIVPEVAVRSAVLQAAREFVDLTSMDFAEEIWLACHDDDEENASIAKVICEENALEADEQDPATLLSYLDSLDASLRRAAARSIAASVVRQPATFVSVLESLENRYTDLAKPKELERDKYGLVKKTDLRDPWEGREGIALAFKELSPSWPTSELVPFAEFLVSHGPLGDRSNTVREAMISGATQVISLHGQHKIEELMRMFESALASSARDEGYSDEVNEAVVILYGALARHLPDGDKRVTTVLDRLLEALATPSESVQHAVANCLPPLVRKVPEKASDYTRQTLERTLTGRQYAQRRGAAYGLAGIIQGRGILALQENRVLSALKAGIENKKDSSQRQGALFAYEMFSLILGRAFEPYVIQIVPHLIVTFGDANADVREACLDAAKTCFSNLSSYGVKVILPILLEGLDETQWRSKKGACDLLGAMAYLDPQQLASSLPDIIPPLTGVLTDSHKEVRASANRSLQRFGEVISSPEVKSQVNILLKALSDPTKHTDEALDALLKVSFVHYLDAPSLALVVRILERGLGDRSGTKRKAAQIIGSLAHLTDRKDLVTYLPILVAGLRSAVVDPVPATRSTSSKALGSLVEKLGEDALPDLVPNLMTTLQSDVGAGDRLGAAQALSEVLAGLGTTRLEEALPAILQNASSNRANIREAFVSLFIFLPACFGNSFSAYLSRVIPPILSGLADELESIRETALRAGRLLVKNFATKSIDLLLPELDRGLADDCYRIRLSSVELVGDLLFSLTGTMAKEEGEEDEDRVKETSQSLLEVLGEEKRNKVLSSLYICRCDTSGVVRSAAISVWKSLVASPRMLKELVPTLSQILIKRLASSNPEQKLIAGNALGELIRKAGEGILATLLPTLEEELQIATDSDNKQGICIALREVISSASPESLVDYEDTLISVVRSALVDSDAEVRDTAAEAFDSLQQVIGRKAVDRVLPHLLNLLRTKDEADQALSALLTLLTNHARANAILPTLIPTLLIFPMTSFNARAVASLSKVASTSISRKLPAILNALMDNIVPCKDEALKQELQSAFDTVLVSADEFEGLNTIIAVMKEIVKHEDHRRRAEASARLGVFFSAAEVDFSRYYPDMVRLLLLAFEDRDTEVVKAACAALIDLTKRLRKEEMESLVVPTRQVLQQVGVPGHNLPGFCLPKGISSILPIFLQGLMNGSAEQRTQAALAISDVIDRTSPDALKPFVTNITGPLIRVVSEKSVDLKCITFSGKRP